MFKFLTSVLTVFLGEDERVRAGQIPAEPGDGGNRASRETSAGKPGETLRVGAGKADERETAGCSGGARCVRIYAASGGSWRRLCEHLAGAGDRRVPRDRRAGGVR